MKLIVGLGNPGKQYERTRHNVGFLVIDELSKMLNTACNQIKFKGLACETRLGTEKIILLKPHTYMNLSGESIIAAMRFYKLTPDQLLVIYDDMDTPIGQIRLRYKGSAGGHNGIKSLLYHIGTEDFKRIRVGIGRPPQGKKVVDYVLENFREDEIGEMALAVEKSAKAAIAWVSEPFDQVMNQFN